MRPFEDFLNGDVKKTIIDRNIAKSLLEQAMRRLAYVDAETITEDNCDFILEQYYEAMRTLADAVLALNGYKSYSHEASIAFLEKDKDFSPMLLEGFDRLRRLRHGIRYYGKRVSMAEAKDARELARVIVPKLKEKIK
jgi:hypothetical protein